MSWVDVRNFDRLMRNMRGSSDEEVYGLAHYFNKIIEQNKQIIDLLNSIDSNLRL